MATITSLGFNITAKWDGAGLKAAQAQLDSLKKTLSSIDGQSLRITADVDDSAAVQKLNALRSMITNQTVSVNVNADTTAASAKLSAIQNQLDRIAGTHATATATVNTDTGRLDLLRAELERFGATRYVATADVNTDRAHTGLLTLARDADNSTNRLHVLGGGAGDAGNALTGMGGAAGGASGGVSSIGSSASGAGASMGGLATATGIAAAALAAIGPVAALASAAMIGALGTGFVALGTLALSQTAVVKEAFTGLKNSVMADALQAAQGMKGPLLAGIAELQSGLHQLVPAFSQAFSAAAPLIKPLVDSFLQFTNNIMPGVIGAIRAAGPVFDGLRSGMAALGSGMSQMFAGMAAGAKGAGAALSVALGGIGKILGIVGTAFGQMASAGAKALSGLMSGLTSLVSGAMAGFVSAVKIMNSTLGPFLAQLGKFAGQILQGLLPALASLMSALMAGLTPVMKALGPIFITIGQAIAKLGQAFAPLMGVIGQLVAKVITALMPAFTQVVQIWAKAGAQLLTALMPAIIKLTPSIVQLVNAVVKLAIAFLPLMPLIVQLDLLFVKLLVALMPIISVLIQIAAVIIGAFATAIRFIVGLITNFGQTWDTVVHGLKIAWDTVSGALVIAWNAVWNGMKAAAQVIWDAMKAAWSAVVQAFSIVWQTVSSALVTAWNTVWNGMKAAGQAIWDAMKAAWSAVVQAFATIWQTVSSALSTAWNTVWNAMKAAAEAVWNAMKAAWTAFINAMKQIWDTVSSALKAAWEAIWTAVKGFAESTWNVIKGAWQAFVNALKTIWDTVSRALKAAWEAIWTAVKGFAQSTWNVIKGAWQDFVNALKTAWDKGGAALRKAWDAVWNGVKSAAKTVWNAIAKIVGGGVNACIDVVNGIIKAWDAVVDAVGLKSLHLSAVGHVSIPKFAEGGIVVPMTFSGGGLTDYAARHNQRSGNSAFGDLRQGGHVPGYAPGKDTVPAMLSPGEGVLVPEAVRALGGSSWVHWANHEFSNGRGGRPGMYPGGAPGVPMPGHRFASGGIVGNALSYFAGGGSSGDNNSSGGQAQKSVDPNTVGTPSSPALGNSVESVNSMLGKGSSKSITELISNALGLVIPGGSDSTLGKIVHGIANAALGLFGGGATGTILGFIGEKAIGAGFKILEDFADKSLKGKFGNVGNVMDAGVHKILDGLKQRLIDEDNKANQQYMAMAVSGAHSVQAWAPVVLQALALAGAPASWLGPLLSMMAQESGGNPNAVNGWDSNAAAGHPSMGLMQVIGPTFTAYHQPGTSMNILDPIANIAAAINYIQARYGYPPGSPYASGTPSATPGVHLVGENGPEMVLFGGGEEVKNAKDTSDILNSGGGGGSAPGAGGNVGDIPQQKLSQNLAAWKSYMTAIRNTSDATWNGVKQTADNNWSSMSSAATPFASGLAKVFTDAGNSIVGSAKSTWGDTRSTALNTWSDVRTSGVNFNATLQKSFFGTGTAIQVKWRNDWTENKGVSDKIWAEQKVASSQFSSDLQKTYADMGTQVGTSWKNTLTTATADTTKYWTDTKAQYTQGTSDMQTGFVAPVTTMMTTDLPNAFNTSVTAIATGWENLKTTVREPVAAVVDVVFNQGIVAMWNAIAGTFDAPTLDTFTMPGFATGGAVNGAGTGTSDSITARLSHGEHVWTAAEVAGAGGHQNVAALRSAALGGAGVRQVGYGSHFAAGGGVVSGGTAGTVGAPQGGTSSTTAAAAPTGSDALTAAAAAKLGSIKDIANPFIEAAGSAGKDAIAALLPDDVIYKTMLNNMVDQMVGTVTSYITANDVAPTIGGANDAAAQAWADAQVGKPYALGGNFGVTFDCSQYMSGIARAILGETPAPWFTTFAFSGDTAPAGFERELEAPFMIGITNVGVGHTAGTLNGTNYEATPPAVRSGPSARGYNDSMFQDWYGFRPSIEAAVGTVSDSNHLAIIDAALAAAGVPPPSTLADWEDGLNTIITYESAWNPNAINNTDINAQNGVPSQGLAQVIPPTFSAYHVAGTSTNILDPIANVAAAINYIVSVYGSIGNVPGVASIRSGGGYLPYYSGTRGAQAGWHTVGERGPEWVKFRGGEEVLPNGQLPPSNGGNGDINISCPITVHGNMDSDAYQRVQDELIPKLRRMYQQRKGGR